MITVDGGWSSWTEWTQCSVSCGTGSTARVRTCTNPEPKFEGKHCPGDGDEEENCFPLPCPSEFLILCHYSI